MAKFNLNLSDAAYADVNEIAVRLDISMADVVREAVSLLGWVSREISAGNRLMIQRGDQVSELIMPNLERRLRDPPPARVTSERADPEPPRTARGGGTARPTT